jgi:endonuclease/exonuclease/phosphatase family metal-dependent hydrolase
MKNFTLVSILILLVNSHVMIAQQKYMSFNIRFDNPADGEDRWEVRKDELSNMIQKYEPDFLGIQEALPNQVEYLDSQLQNYKYIGFGRDGEGSQSESVPIFYKADRYELLKKEVFWLSETPENPSKGWDAALNRITTYGIFLNRQTRDTLHVFNTHYDHRGEKARVNSSRLLVSKIESMRLRDKKVILMGDFNSRPEEEPVKILNKAFADAYKNSEKEPLGPYGTFNGFDPEAELDQRIDYVFVLNFKVLSYTAVDGKRKNGRWISDHLPILVEVSD